MLNFECPDQNWIPLSQKVKVVVHSLFYSLVPLFISIIVILSQGGQMGQWGGRVCSGGPLWRSHVCWLVSCQSPVLHVCPDLSRVSFSHYFGLILPTTAKLMFAWVCFISFSVQLSSVNSTQFSRDMHTFVLPLPVHWAILWLIYLFISNIDNVHEKEKKRKQTVLFVSIVL